MTDCSHGGFFSPSYTDTTPPSFQFNCNSTNLFFLLWVPLRSAHLCPLSDLSISTGGSSLSSRLNKPSSPRLFSQGKFSKIQTDRKNHILAAILSAFSSFPVSSGSSVTSLWNKCLTHLCVHM